jgi:hypothetical protein
MHGIRVCIEVIDINGRITCRMVEKESIMMVFPKDGEDIRNLDEIEKSSPSNSFPSFLISYLVNDMTW